MSANANARKIDIAVIESEVYYDGDGNLRYKRDAKTGTRKAGDIAGYLESTGYLRVSLNKRNYQVHRLIWALCHRAEPTGVVDHIDGNITNNRIENLRDVSFGENLQNQRKAQKGNESGKLGVTRHGNKWIARIDKNKKQFYIGSFDTVTEASAAYLEMKRKLHQTCNI